MTKQVYCEDCGQPISFHRTINGKWMPVNMAGAYYIPDPHGDGTFIDRWGNTERGILADEEMRKHYKVKAGSIPHWASCTRSKAKERAATERKLQHELAEKKEAERRVKIAQRVEQALMKKRQPEGQLSFFK